MAVVYLIHFEKPYRANSGGMTKTVQHYLGYTANLKSRVAEHRAGRGARLMEIVTVAGIEWEVARVWQGGTRGMERKLKNRHNHAQLCPICQQLKKKEKAIG